MMPPTFTSGAWVRCECLNTTHKQAPETLVGQLGEFPWPADRLEIFPSGQGIGCIRTSPIEAILIEGDEMVVYTTNSAYLLSPAVDPRPASAAS